MEINTSNLLYNTTLDTERQPHWIVNASCLWTCVHAYIYTPHQCVVILPNGHQIPTMSPINILFHTIILKVGYRSACHMDNPSLPINQCLHTLVLTLPTEQSVPSQNLANWSNEVPVLQMNQVGHCQEQNIMSLIAPPLSNSSPLETSHNPFC